MGVSNILACLTMSDSNTAFSTVTRTLIPANFPKTPSLSRVVGVLLVFFVFYGTTVEAAHRHGRVPGPNESQTSVTTPGSAQNPFGTTTGCNDCLTCQLHQHLFASLVSLRTDHTRLSARALPQETHTVSITSLICSPHAGRAPPKVN